MARRRMIDPEFFIDDELSALTAHTRLLYIGLWTLCDDNYATLPEKTQWIKAQIFPYEEVDVEPMISELKKQKKLIAFKDEVTGKPFLFLANFFKYQRVDKPSKPKYPKYPLDNVATPSLDPLSQVKLSKGKLSEVKLSQVKAFESFWVEYPKKVAKKDAYRVWVKISPSEELALKITEAVKKSRSSAQWLKEGGQFVPNPTTYLNQERWNDEDSSPQRKSLDLSGRKN